MSDEPTSLQQMLEDEGIDRDRLRETLDLVHPVDLADLLEDVELDDQIRVVEVLDASQAARVMEALTHDTRVRIVDGMGEERLTAVIDAMSADAVADIIDHLPAHKEKAVLAKLDAEHREDIEELREYAPTSAGGRMTKNFVSVPEHFTAGQTMKALQGAVTAETVSNVYVVDAQERLVGVCGLGNLLRHAADTPVSDFMRRDVQHVVDVVDQEEVVRVARKYDLKAVPVVDAQHRLVGVVTLQDVLDVLHEEANEDVMAIAGAAAMDPVRASLAARVRARIPWLITAMVIEMVLSLVMQGFEGTLALVALAYFIPVIMAMGGNVGLQSSTTVVRGLATGEIGVGKTLRVVLAELRTGAMIGVLCGLATGTLAWLMHAGERRAELLGLIVTISMISSITIAATLGACIPFVLHRMKRDPAVASGPFITSLNDMLNVIIYLSLATFLLARIK